MIIKVSKGEVTLKKLDRKLKKQIRRLLLKDTMIDVDTGKANEVSMEHLMDVAEKAFEILVDKIVIDGKDYTFRDLEKLNSDGKFTDDDWDLCEEETQQYYNDVTTQKKRKN